MSNCGLESWSQAWISKPRVRMLRKTGGCLRRKAWWSSGRRRVKARVRMARKTGGRLRS